MCTAISYQTNHHYFGRNLDLEYHFNEVVAITPRNYALNFRSGSKFKTHYAMIGMAVVEDGYPLYYEATNETGLSMAALNFPGNAHYFPVKENKDNVSSFELIPWVLSQCNNLNEAKQKFAKLNIINVAFSDKFPTSPLHWMVCDATGSLIVEQTEAGLAVYEDPVGVLTNNPPFPYHLYNLNNYLHVTASEPVNRFSNSIELTPYSRGMGGIGLPGDLSSASRFVRASFTKLNSVSGNNELESVSQFFHILGSVAQQRGCAKVGDAYEITLYSSCCNTNTGTYYYKTYENSQITAIKMHNYNLNESKILTFPLIAKQNIRYMN